MACHKFHLFFLCRKGVCFLLKLYDIFVTTQSRSDIKYSIQYTEEAPLYLNSSVYFKLYILYVCQYIYETMYTYYTLSFLTFTKIYHSKNYGQCKRNMRFSNTHSQQCTEIYIATLREYVLFNFLLSLVV